MDIQTMPDRQDTTPLSEIVSQCKRDRVEALRKDYDTHKELVLQAVLEQFEATKELYMCFVLPTYGDRYTIETKTLKLSWAYKPATASQPCEVTFICGEDPPKELREAGISQLLDFSERLIAFEHELDQRILDRVAEAKQFLQERSSSSRR